MSGRVSNRTNGKQRDGRVAGWANRPARSPVRMAVGLIAVVALLSRTGVGTEILPEEYRGVGITERLGEQVDLDLTFVDHRGQAVRILGVHIGAGVVHSAIEDGLLPDVTNGFLPFVAGQIAYRAVRNRGTIGGSVAHADPAGDWPTALLVLGASAVIAGKDGRRSVALEDFQVGAFTVALEPEEVLCSLEIPALSPSACWGHYKVCRKPGEFAESIGTVVVDKDRGFARAVLGATDGAPILLPDVAERLKDSGADGFGVEEAKTAIAATGATFDSYLTQIHAVALSRAAKRAFAL